MWKTRSLFKTAKEVSCVHLFGVQRSIYMIIIEKKKKTYLCLWVQWMGSLIRLLGQELRNCSQIFPVRINICHCCSHNGSLYLPSHFIFSSFVWEGRIRVPWMGWKMWISGRWKMSGSTAGVGGRGCWVWWALSSWKLNPHLPPSIDGM